MLKTKKEVYDYVVDDYSKYDTELNGLYFDFDVSMPKIDILDVYASLQHDINGDIVMHITNPILENHSDGEYIYGIPTQDNDPRLKEVYTGNMMKFLELYNDCEMMTGWCRVYETEEHPNNSDMLGGQKLDFVF